MSAGLMKYFQSHTAYIRPIQQGLTKLYCWKPHHAQPAMCALITPQAAYPRSRESLELSKALPSNNCYHFTGYSLCARVLLEWHDYYQSLRVRARFFPEFVKPLAEDMRTRLFKFSAVKELLPIRTMRRRLVLSQYTSPEDHIFMPAPAYQPHPVKCAMNINPSQL
ncbi:hypothetical protein EDD85DRAFT_949542 [Armillaria nabsnona]|nr:hypothetical protein EDD85DRAFT_949542 [Armillaria nabsnona]